MNSDTSELYSNSSESYSNDNFFEIQNHLSSEKIIMITTIAIASLGMISNLIVIVAFLNDKKLRKKIPNMFIINQVGKFCLLSY